MPGNGQLGADAERQEPPSRKKMKAVVMYMTPIFLWSVVVSHS